MKNEKKLTDEEIVKALKNCTDIENEEGCENCPFSTGRCIDLKIHALDLINRQNAEIERLTEEIDQRRNMMQRMDCNYATELQKNDKLQKQVDELKEKIVNLKSAMIDRVARKSYDSLLTMPEDVEEIFGDAYESEFNKLLTQAVKDTAKEILTELFHANFETKCTVSNYRNSKEDIEIVAKAILAVINEKIKEIAKRYGVEVE